MFDAPPARRIDPCSLGKWLNELPEADRINLQLWLDADDVRHIAIVRMIQEQAGRSFDKATVSDHRRQLCRCALRKESNV